MGASGNLGMHLVEPEPCFVREAGVRNICVWDYGGDGPSLLLGHHTGGCARLWDPIASMLRARFRVLAIDCRGHGDSTMPLDADACAWPRSGEDLLAAIDALDLKTPLLAAGHSAGAAHILYAESMRPGTFARAVLVEAICGPENPAAGAHLAGLARRRVNRFPSRDKARARLGAKPPFNRWDARVFDAYLAHALRGEGDEVVLKLPGDQEAWFYEHGLKQALFDALPGIALPSQLVVGSESDVAPLIPLQLARMPNATAQTLDGASHFTPNEQPDAIAQAILDWCAG